MLRVLVPANYFSPHNRSRSYPVLYMQDGQNLFDKVTAHSGEWHMDETVEHLVGGFKICRCSSSASTTQARSAAPSILPYPDPLNTRTPSPTRKAFMARSTRASS